MRTNIPYLKLNGPEPGPRRIPTNLNLSVEFIEGEGLALLGDVNGIALASGAACVGKAVKIPPVLTAIGLVRLLDVYLPSGVWVADLIIGGIFTFGGLFLWRRAWQQPRSEER